MIKAIIFDCFGVLITDGLQMICDELGRRDPKAVEQVKRLIHAANKGILPPEQSSEQVAAILGIPVEEYRRQVRENEVRNAPLLEFIKTLRPAYKVGLLSNINSDGLRRRFPNNELDQYFDAVVVSSEIGYAKPEAQAYHIAAEQLNVLPAECILIDDREDFCAAAEKTSMRAILYRGYEQFQTDLQGVLSGT